MINSTPLTIFPWQYIMPVLSRQSDEIPSGAKVIFLLLILLSQENGKCSLSQRFISNVVGLSERQVREHLKLLRNLGAVSKVTSPTHSTADIYDLMKYWKGGNCENPSIAT